MSDTASEQALAYVREHYRVPAEVGRRVTVDGNPGTITGGQNAHLVVDFGGYTVPCHPTWRVSYDGSPLSAPVTASAARDGEHQPASTYGACGHELDPWETHLEHHPECPADGSGGHWTAENLPAELTAMLDAAAGREHSATGSVRASLAAILNRYDEMLSSIARTSPSDHLGACGHELDAWETHVQHHPECEREMCLEVSCDCPEVCPDCCIACAWDLALRMQS